MPPLRQAKKKIGSENNLRGCVALTLSGLQSPFGGKLLRIILVCPQKGTSVLKGLIGNLLTSQGEIRRVFVGGGGGSARRVAPALNCRTSLFLGVQ